MSDLSLQGSQGERQKCAVCESELSFRWTDTHGVGVCTTCGAPYTLYHYDEATNARLDKPPELALKESGVEIARRYWNEKRRRVFPACCDMGILGSRSCSYSGATSEDIRLFGEWYAAQSQQSTDIGEQQ
jgi:hypothetical protein